MCCGEGGEPKVFNIFFLQGVWRKYWRESGAGIKVIL